MATFKDLIKLEYPKAFPDELRAMIDFVSMLSAYEEAAAAAAKAKQQQVEQLSRAILTAYYLLPSTYSYCYCYCLLQVEQLFRAIDADASGCIDEVRNARAHTYYCTCYSRPTTYHLPPTAQGEFVCELERSSEEHSLAAP